MKLPPISVLILGPAETSSYFGGVAVFCEGNACSASQAHGSAAVLNQQVLKIYQNGSLVAEEPTGPLTFIRKLVQILRSKPRYIALQLQYGILAPLLRMLAPEQTHSIFYAHGFPPHSYSMPRRAAILTAYHLGRRYCSEFISNSHYTASILEAIWGIKSDRVVNPAVPDTFLKTLAERAELPDRKGDYHFLYVGRLTTEKGLLNIVNTLARLKHREARLDIIGDGPGRAPLERMAAELGVEVQFHGRLASRQVAVHMRSFRSFVSANPHEPFGITYAEAAAAGCTVYCPPSGGQIDIARQRLDKFTFIDFTDWTAAAREIEQSIASRNALVRPTEWCVDSISSFTYEACARKLFP